MGHRAGLDCALNNAAMDAWAPQEAGLHEILVTIRQSTTEHDRAVQTQVTHVRFTQYTPRFTWALTTS